MKGKYLIPIIFTALGLFIVTPPTLEAVVLFNLSTEFSGGSDPSGAPPWATVSIVDNGAGGVNVTFNTDGLSASEFITEWDLNFTGDASLLSSSIVGTGPLATFAGVNNGIMADGDTGNYDVGFTFPSGPPGDRLNANLSVTYSVTSSGGNINETMFNTTNDPSSKGGPYYTAAHVQGINADPTSGWIGSTPVPEPSTYLMLGSFVAVAAFLKRRKTAKVKR